MIWACVCSGDGDLPLMWIFPYFFEPRILDCLPSLTMLDYQVPEVTLSCPLQPTVNVSSGQTVAFVSDQVDYDNHPLYKHGKTGRKQSPVRLFTNIPPRDVVLPEEEGYRCRHTPHTCSASCARLPRYHGYSQSLVLAATL